MHNKKINQLLIGAMLAAMAPAAAAAALVGAAALSRADWLSCNRGEAEVIAGAGSCPEMAARLLEVHCPTAAGVLIRAGSEGAWLACRGEAPVFVPAFAVRTTSLRSARTGSPPIRSSFRPTASFHGKRSSARVPASTRRWSP